MSRFQDLKDFTEQRLLTAVIRDEGEQRKLLHRAGVQLLMVNEEELPAEQQERSPYPDQEDEESPHIKEEQEDQESPFIKEEQEELWISQGREQLQGLEEADNKFLFPSVHMKSESDEEEPQSSLLHQRLTDHMETAAGGEDCERPEPAGSSGPERHLQPEIEVEIEASSDSGSETEDGADDWMETRDYLERLKSASNKRAEPGETNDMVSLTEKRPFCCSECGKGYTRKQHLKVHMFFHTKEKPFCCSECGKGFTRNGDLKLHMLVHTKEKHFSCSTCEKKFTRKADLKIHMFVHTKEKPFSCSECGKRFNHKGNLSRHVSVHLTEKRFSCSVCGKGFNQKGNLTAHMFVHTEEKPYNCPKCGKGFSRKDGLADHMSLHMEEKPYTCDFCGKGFNQKKRLTAHMFVHT